MKPLTNLIHTGLLLALSCMLVACLGGGGNSTSIPVAPTPTLALFAGNISGTGNNDGPGAMARFNTPYSVATDTSGNVYVADTGNKTIRKITPTGVVSTLAGTPGISGSADGIGAAASFYNPIGVATDNADNVYVADSWNFTIRKITPAGVVSTMAGTPGVMGRADGTGAAASFMFPSGVATDSAGNVYVADTGNSTIRKITPAGVVSTLAGGAAGTADRNGTAASFSYPHGVATDSAGNVYVTDTGEYPNSDASFPEPPPTPQQSTIRKITPAGVVTTLAGTPSVIGSADGSGPAASFNFPTGIATDNAGNVYVADTGNNTIRKITPPGVVSTVVGIAGVAGFSPGSLPGALSSPRGVAVSGSSLYITLDNGVAVVNNVP